VVVTIAIAHRGDPASERENTLAAFSAAVLQGADMVEFDLRRSRDGTIVVLHDATLHRLWGVDRAVTDLDLDEIRAIGTGDERIPTLGQALELLSVPLMVDFTAEDVVDGAVDDVRQADAMDRALFVSRDLDALHRVRWTAPEARIGLSWIEPHLPSPVLLRELGAEFWNPWFPLATPENVGAMHDLGVRVSTWTVDDAADMQSVFDAGVDAIVSNEIAELRRFLD
jgi:myo-inositol-1(or 4)-monophosphatase/deoxyribonuclease-2